MPIEILDPTAERPASQPASSVRWSFGGLAGRRVALFGNGKPNVDHLFAELQRLLRERYQVASVQVHGKPRASRAATADELEPVLQGCQVALVAIGD